MTRLTSSEEKLKQTAKSTRGNTKMIKNMGLEKPSFMTAQSTKVNSKTVSDMDSAKRRSELMESIN